jgi:hypothetical protein
MQLGALKEKRRHSRFFLDLPLEFRVMDVPVAYGGIAVDGSEAGLLVHSLSDMPIGERLNVAVLFPNGFELANFEVAGEIVRKDRCEGGKPGYRYGLKLVEVKEGDYVKLKYILSGLHQLVNGDEIVLDPKR